jgi:hypothetical protein
MRKRMRSEEIVCGPELERGLKNAHSAKSK